MRNLRAFEIDLNVLPIFLAGKAIFDSGIPEDCKVVHAGYRWETNSYVLILEHPSFPAVPINETVTIESFTLKILR